MSDVQEADDILRRMNQFGPLNKDAIRLSKILGQQAKRIAELEEKLKTIKGMHDGLGGLLRQRDARIAELEAALRELWEFTGRDRYYASPELERKVNVALAATEKQT